MNETPLPLNVEAIQFDTENPRIKMALEKYGDQLTSERIHFALKSATEGSRTVSSYSSLKDSIRASRGILVPIVVTKRDGELICIDGNTRLAIYKEFHREAVPGDWSEIKAVLLDDVSTNDIESIRISAHLVGSREWPAYEKARYLHYLRTSEFWDYSELIALCGGNKREIERQIDAYHDMNQHYRDLVDDTAFHIDRFSGFVELQRPRIKEAIFEAGLQLSDFGQWIRDGKIFRLADVRKLPLVLGNETAKDIFLNGGLGAIEEASQCLEKQRDLERTKEPTTVSLEAATLHDVAAAASRKIQALTHVRVRAMKARETSKITAEVAALEELLTHLQQLLDDVTE